jgi:hypothetical protein
MITCCSKDLKDLKENSQIILEKRIKKTITENFREHEDKDLVNIVKKSKVRVIYKKKSINSHFVYLEIPETLFKKIEKAVDVYNTMIQEVLAKEYYLNRFVVIGLPLSVIIEKKQIEYEERRQHIKKYPTAKSELSESYPELYSKKPEMNTTQTFEDWKKDYFLIKKKLSVPTGDFFKDKVNRQIYAEFKFTNERTLRKMWLETLRNTQSLDYNNSINTWQKNKRNRDFLEKEWRSKYTSLNVKELNEELEKFLNSKWEQIAFDQMYKRWMNYKKILIAHKSFFMNNLDRNYSNFITYRGNISFIDKLQDKMNSFKNELEEAYKTVLNDIQNLVDILSFFDDIYDEAIDEKRTLFRARTFNKFNKTVKLNTLIDDQIKKALSTETELKFYENKKDAMQQHRWLQFALNLNKLYDAHGNAKSIIEKSFEELYDEFDFQGYSEVESGPPNIEIKRKINRGGRWDEVDDLFMYLATCGDLSIYEIQPYKNQIVSLGYGKPKRKLKLLNLIYEDRELPIPDSGSFSIYDIMMFPDIVSLVSMGDESNYVLTRLISKVAKEKGYDGIMYKSRLYDNGQFNIVLFNENDFKFEESKLLKVNSIEYTFSYCDFQQASQEMTYSMFDN